MRKSHCVFTALAVIVLGFLSMAALPAMGDNSIELGDYRAELHGYACRFFYKGTPLISEQRSGLLDSIRRMKDTTVRTRKGEGADSKTLTIEHDYKGLLTSEEKVTITATGITVEHTFTHVSEQQVPDFAYSDRKGLGPSLQSFFIQALSTEIYSGAKVVRITEKKGKLDVVYAEYASEKKQVGKKTSYPYTYRFSQLADRAFLKDLRIPAPGVETVILQKPAFDFVLALEEARLDSASTNLTYRFRPDRYSVFAGYTFMAPGGKIFYKASIRCRQHENIKEPERFPSPEPGLALRFVQVADTHMLTKKADKWNRGKNFARAVEEINELGPGFVLHCGDVVEKCGRKHYERFVKIAAPMKATMHTTVGNHEMVKDDDSVPHDAYKEFTKNDLYHSFDYKNYHIVCLYSAPSGGHEGAIDDEQIKWLEKDLEEHSKKPTIVFTHIPIYWLRGKKNIPTWTIQGNREKLLELLNSHNVLMFLCGHLHKYIHTKTDTDRFYQIAGPAISWSAPKKYDAYGSAYLIYDVYPDKVNVFYKPLRYPYDKELSKVLVLQNRK